MAEEKTPEIVNMERAQKAYKQARSAYKSDRSDAKSTLKKAQRSHDKDVKSAEKALEEERERLTRPLASFAGAKLYWDHIEHKKSSLALEEGMVVEVNSSGNTYTAVANTGTVETSSSSPVASASSSAFSENASIDEGGVSTASRDTRNLFITLKTSNNSMTIQCDPDKEKGARDFADDIAAAASKVTAQAEVNRSRINEAHNEIAKSRGDVDGVNLARDSFTTVESDTTQLDEAKLRLDQAVSAVPPEELNEYRSVHRRRKAVAILVCVILVIIVLVAVYVLLR